MAIIYKLELYVKVRLVTVYFKQKVS